MSESKAAPAGEAGTPSPGRTSEREQLRKHIAAIDGRRPEDGHSDRGFATCPHPDCAAFRVAGRGVPDARLSGDELAAITVFLEAQADPASISATGRIAATLAQFARRALDASVPDAPLEPPVENRHEETKAGQTEERRVSPENRSTVVQPVSEVDQDRGLVEPSSLVAGVYMDRSLADFQRACEVHIGEEQRRANPDTALIAVLCDAVRCSRELALVATKADALPAAVPAALRAPREEALPTAEEVRGILHARESVKWPHDLEQALADWDQWCVEHPSVLDNLAKRPFDLILLQRNIVGNLLADLRELEQLYATDKVASWHAWQIERIFDRWLYGAAADAASRRPRMAENEEKNDEEQGDTRVETPATIPSVRATA